MPEIRFELPFPSEQRAVVEKSLRDNEWLLPKWVEVIWVKYERNPPNKTTSTRISVNEEYRSIVFMVCEEWLLTQPHVRESDIRHEFIHVATNPLHRFGLQMVNLLDDGHLKNWAREELRLATERTTTDLEFAIARGIVR